VIRFGLLCATEREPRPGAEQRDDAQVLPRGERDSARDDDGGNLGGCRPLRATRVFARRAFAVQQDPACPSGLAVRIST
jgi:hypothetical protein